jgi:glucokinase
MKYVLGIDLGGTKVLAGVIDVHSGEILSKAKKRSHAEHGPKDLVARLVDAAKDALQQSNVKTADIDSIGIGVAGQIDTEKGVVINAPNLAGMTDVRLASIVSDELGKPVRLSNDVEAAAAGEAAFGAGRASKDFVVVFVGTGVGGAIYRDGQPYYGGTNTAGEIGHTIVDVGGRVCSCGQTGHLEAYASRTAIVKIILGGLQAGRKSVTSKLVGEANPNDPGGSGIRSKAIATALVAHDDLVREAVFGAAEYLAASLASIINFYNPPLIILGGGLIEAVDEFFVNVAKQATQMSLSVPRTKVKIVKAGLGDYSGIVGAAVLARNS